MIGIPLGLLYANAGEWLIHKYVLHGVGRDRSSFWSFHFHEHHRAVRAEDGFDPDYERSVVGWHAQGKEALGLAAAAVAHLPLLPIAPMFTGAVLYSIGRYYVVHKKSHLDPEWAREHVPWHYDHHMGPNPHCNWGVTWPWFDHVMGTREYYVGTEREKRDRARKAEFLARRAQANARTSPNAPEPSATTA